MSDIVYRIDSIDKDDHNLLYIDGWAYAEGKEQVEVELVADGKAAMDARIVYKERMDVVKSRPDERVPEKCGFTCYIEYEKLLVKGYKSIELRLRAGTLSKRYTFNIKDVVKDYGLYLWIDELSIKKDRLFIRGWKYYVFGEVSLKLYDKNNKPLPCELEPEFREDINRLFGADEKESCGFSIYVDLNEINTKIIFLSAIGIGDEVQKELEINVAKLKRENSLFTKFQKAYGPSNFFENLRYIKKYGFRQFKYKSDYIFKDEETTDYEFWAEKHRVSERELKRQKKEKLSYRPLISIVIPLYNTPVDFFCDLIECFIAQSYPNWQLCLADASDTEGLKELLEKRYASEKRIKYLKLKKNGGISENTNEAIKLSEGEYIMFSDHDDLIEPDTLYEIAKVLNADRSIDIIYTDEDKVELDKSSYFYPHFKPDYNMFALLSSNYITHIFVVRKELADKVGMLNKEMDGSQDYDYILRCCEQSDRIYHIPKVLYHWRVNPASVAGDPENKPYAYIVGTKALQSHLDRVGIPAKACMSERLGYYLVDIEPDGSERVSVVVVSDGNVERDIRLILSVGEKISYDNYDILYCACDEDISKCRESLSGRSLNISFISMDLKCGFSATCNKAAESTEADKLVFLFGVEDFICDGWLEKMLGCFKFSDVKAVGARLEYPNGKIYHCGIALGIGEDRIGAQLYYGENAEHDAYMYRDKTLQNLSAVSAECIMVSRKDFIEAGGMNEALEGIYASIDLCLRLREKDGLIVYNGNVSAVMSEVKEDSQYMGKAASESEKRQAEYIRSKWGRVISAGDPYYNPSLTLDKLDFSLDYLRL